MADKLPVFEIEIDSDDDLGVDAVALVGSPAIMVGWVAQSQQHQQRYERSWILQSDRQELTGPLSIPNQLIFRDGPEGPHYITYSAATIRRMAERFLEKGNQLNLNVEHEPERRVQAVVMESWIKESDADKSKALGYDLPDGTWMITVKVKDTDFWQEQIKTGRVKGFSLEGYFGQDLKRYEYQSISNPTDQPMTEIQQAGGLEKQLHQAFKDAVKQLKKYKNSKSGQTLLTRLEKDNGFDYFTANTQAVLKALAKAEEEEKQAKQKQAQQGGATSALSALRQLFAPKPQEQQPLTQQEQRQLRALLSRINQEDMATVIADEIEDIVSDAVEDAVEAVVDVAAAPAPVAQMTLPLADGGEVFIDDANVAYIDGNPASPGDYALADGGTLRVADGGQVIEMLAPDMAVSQLAQVAQSQAQQIAQLQEELNRLKKQGEKQLVKQTQAPKPSAPKQTGVPSKVNLTQSSQQAFVRRDELYRLRDQINERIREQSNKNQQIGGR